MLEFHFPLTHRDIALLISELENMVQPSTHDVRMHVWACFYEAMSAVDNVSTACMELYMDITHLNSFLIGYPPLLSLYPIPPFLGHLPIWNRSLSLLPVIYLILLFIYNLDFSCTRNHTIFKPCVWFISLGLMSQGAFTFLHVTQVYLCGRVIFHRV